MSTIEYTYTYIRHIIEQLRLPKLKFLLHTKRIKSPMMTLISHGNSFDKLFLLRS